MSTVEEDWLEIEDEILEADGIPQPINDETEIVSKGGSESELFQGKHFNSLEEAELFYIEYASTRGYSVRKRTRYTRGRDPTVTGYLFTCAREGYYKQKESVVEDSSIKRNRSHNRKGCMARMSVHRLRETDIWEVKIFSDEHSHELVSPSKQVLLRSNRKISEAARKLKVFDWLQIDQIPQYFIMKRWTKKANEGRVVNCVTDATTGCSRTVSSRTSILSRYAVKIACVAGRTEEGYNMFYELLDNVYPKLKDLDDLLLQK